MSKRYVLEADEINSLITRKLFNYIGPGAYSNNYNDIIIRLVEALLHPTIDYPIAMIVDEIATYGIKPLDARDIFSELTSFMATPIYNLLGSKIGSHNFEVAINYGLLEIYDKGVIKENNDKNSREDNWIQSIREDVENGDWVPPKYRQLAGLL